MVATEQGRRTHRAAIAALSLYSCVVLITQITLIIDPNYLHEELRPLYRYYQFAEPGLFAGDYLTSFAEAFPTPHLYEWMTWGWLRADGSLQTLHRLLPLTCWITLIVGMAVASRQIGSHLMQLAVPSVVIAQPLYLYQITAAGPHAFALPLLIWALVGLLHRSSTGLALITILAGLLYPVVAPIIGLLLVWQVVSGDQTLAGHGGKKLKEYLLLALTGGVSLYLLLGVLSGPDQFGTAMAPMESADIYPENGPKGRHFYGVQSPALYVVGKAFTQFRDAFGVQQLSLFFAYCAIAGYGLFMLPKESESRRALFVFILSSTVVGLLVLVFKPFHLYRFFLYPSLIAFPLLFVAGLEQFFRRLICNGRRSATAGTIVLTLFVLAFDSTNHRKLGYWLHLEPEHHQVLSFAGRQPPGTTFAVWPGGFKHFEFIPYFARQPLFVMSKLHSSSYEDHVLQMRARMYALIDGYLATDQAKLAELHCAWGVDYLVVEKAHFVKNGSYPVYFAPFDARIEKIWTQRERGDFVLRDPDPAAIALETDNYLVVRLGSLAKVAEQTGHGCRS